MPIISLPKLYLGTMNFGWSQASSKVDEKVAIDMIKSFLHHTNVICPQPISFIDTARVYAGEHILGAALQQLEQHPHLSAISVGTKAHPSQPGGLSPAGVRSQLAASQTALGLNTFGEYYLHQPDTNHSVLSSQAVSLPRSIQSVKSNGRKRFAPITEGKWLLLCSI
jgi:aflatoxin B1 aldehyde reductase